jgi:hypothetical protein
MSSIQTAARPYHPTNKWLVFVTITFGKDNPCHLLRGLLGAARPPIFKIENL